MMTEDLHIYFPPTGRISIAGLNPGNIDKVAQGIAHVIRVTSA
jgi:aspartate/tyrosine/aromatic aminotransferase